LIYRWLYKIWKYFWITIGVLAAIVLAVMLVAGITLQLPATKDYLRAEVVKTFNEQFEGTLEIESIGGIIPIRTEVTGGRVFAPSDTTRPVVAFQKANVTINWWELIRQNLSISSFEVHQPVISIFQHENEIALIEAFTQREQDVTRKLLDPDSPRIFNRLNIFAPYLSIVDGELHTDDSITLPDHLRQYGTIDVEKLNTTLFLELTDTQIFADVLNFSAEIPGTEMEFVQFTGQFYSDNRYFELNRFSLNTAIAEIEFSIEASPVNIYAGNLEQQFRDAGYRAEIRSSSIKPGLISRFIPAWPDFGDELMLEMAAEGTIDELFIDRFQASVGQSAVIITAVTENLLDENFRYNIQLENLVMHPDELEFITGPYIQDLELDAYEISTIRGDIYGNLQEINSDIRMQTASGSMRFDSRLTFPGIPEYEFLAEIDSLDLSPVFRDTVNSTMLNGRIAGKGTGFDRDAAIEVSADLGSSVIAGFPFEKIIGEFGYDSRTLNYSMLIEENSSALQASGSFRNDDGYMYLVSDGSMTNMNLPRYIDLLRAESTSLTGTFSANLQGSDPDDIYGRFSMEMEESVIGADSLRPHQLYADIDSPENSSRTLRFTSSFFDGELRGTLTPSLIQNASSYWGNYLQERVRNELLFDEDFVLFATDEPETDDYSLDLNLNIFIKDLDLLRSYLPGLPEVNSSARMNATLNADNSRMMFSGNIYDDNLDIRDISVTGLNSSLSANFRYGERLRDYAVVDLQVNSTQAVINEMNFNDSYLNLSMRNDSLEVNQKLVRDDDISLETTLLGVIKPGLFEINIKDFNLGSSRYMWRTEGEPQLVYTDYDALTVRGLVLSSDNDLLEVNGTFSSSFEDSVQYNIKNFDISRVSDLIGGRITFSGIVNGDFVTRSLTDTPSVAGNIDVTEGRIDGRLIGDVSLRSSYNPELERFDTDIRVYTDPDKYSSYYNRNDGIGQDLRLSGYFKIPDADEPDEDYFYFDADLREIDMWIVTFIVPTIIQEMEGRSSGTGYIRASRNEFDFDSTFDIRDVLGVPAFTNVHYTLNGELQFNRHDGLLFKDIQLTDRNGGRGKLSGQVDLNDLDPTTFIDLTIDLDNLHFMNNPYDPDIPFYASLYGTGQARITGTNFSPFLRTTQTVNISSNSRISIPLEDETEFEQDRRFIQFVETFDLSLLDRRAREGEENGNGDVPPEELTFIERFTMDLNFTANNPINVQLIFDRVTNEVLNANGTGQVRILLEDQDVSMFGRFNIQSGDYQFVSGDIFTRRFTLQEGGSISWQGDLTDANLNVTALYRARPLISSLVPSARAAETAGTGRIPIELVLQIGGTITEVENDFFFRVPTGIEGTLDPTIATQINNLNQNEEQKLIQATSILLSGNFLPTDSAQNFAFADGVTGTAAVVNPLLTSQVINPLLSNQINSLLRSDITFDIDLNLTAFNEVDLGVALRLFDDRVILRREGQIGGQENESNIGDLGATYRINRTFSLTAFHRQDPTLTYTSGGGAGSTTTQTQEMNGVGLEARVQFNTWQSFRQRISGAFRSLFGIQKKEEDPEESESLAEN
jgi:hypothetical protein